MGIAVGYKLAASTTARSRPAHARCWGVREGAEDSLGAHVLLRAALLGIEFSAFFEDAGMEVGLSRRGGGKLKA